MPPKARKASSGPSGAKARKSSSGPSGTGARSSNSGPSGAGARSSTSRGPSSAGAKKAARSEQLEKEAEELFERFEPSGKLDGVLKLAQFAEVIRHMNSKKCMIWGDDPVDVIRREWTTIGGKAKVAVTLEDFKSWWPNFVEGVDAELAEKEEQEAARLREIEERYGSGGLWQIKLKDLQEAMKFAAMKGLTPLILDNTPAKAVESFFLYSNAHVVDCKRLVVEKAKGGDLGELLEEERARFFKSMSFKGGRTVVFRLSNTACDLNNMFNSEAFPSLALLDRAQLSSVMGQAQVEKVEGSPFMKMAASSDEALEMKAYGIHEEFNVAVVTCFEEDTYEEYLKPMIPLHLMQPIKPNID